MNNNYYEGEIDLIDLCLYLFKKIKQVLVFSICITLLSTCVFFVKNNIDLKDEKKIAEIEKAQTRVDYLEKYKDESIYLNLDPHNIYSSTLIIEVYGLDSSYYSNSLNAKDSLSKETNEILNKYISVYNVSDLNNLIDGVEDRYVRELIEVTSSDTFLMVTAKSGDKDTASLLSSKVAEIITSKHDQVKETSSHKIRYFTNASTTTVIDTDVEKAYEDFNKELKEANSALNKLKNDSLLKNALKDFVGGAFIICAYYAVIYLVNGRYATSKSLEKRTGIRCFGTLYTKSDKSLGERVYKDKETALSYIKNTYNIEIKDNEKLLLTSSLSLDENEVEDIIKSLGDNVIYASDYLHNPEVIEKLKDVKNVVLVEKACASSINDIKKIKAQLKDLDIRLAGFIELN